MDDTTPSDYGSAEEVRSAESLLNAAVERVHSSSSYVSEAVDNYQHKMSEFHSLTADYLAATIEHDKLDRSLASYKAAETLLATSAEKKTEIAIKKAEKSYIVQRHSKLYTDSQADVLRIRRRLKTKEKEWINALAIHEGMHLQTGLASDRVTACQEALTLAETRLAAVEEKRLKQEATSRPLGNVWMAWWRRCWQRKMIGISVLTTC